VAFDETTPVRSPLFEAVPVRQCSRSIYDGRPLPANELHALETVAQGEGRSDFRHAWPAPFARPGLPMTDDLIDAPYAPLHTKSQATLKRGARWWYSRDEWR
jgi:hypothetical protein